MLQQYYTFLKNTEIVCRVDKYQNGRRRAKQFFLEGGRGQEESVRMFKQNIKIFPNV